VSPWGRAAPAERRRFDSRERRELEKRYVVVESVVRPFHEDAGALLFSSIRKGMGSPKTAARLMTPAMTLRGGLSSPRGELMYAVHLASPGQYIGIVSRSHCAQRSFCERYGIIVAGRIEIGAGRTTMFQKRGRMP
jgi:hypothetical protein